jgi:hypothetical protein
VNSQNNQWDASVLKGVNVGRDFAIYKPSWHVERIRDDFEPHSPALDAARRRTKFDTPPKSLWRSRERLAQVDSSTY